MRAIIFSVVLGVVLVIVFSCFCFGTLRLVHEKESAVYLFPIFQ